MAHESITARLFTLQAAVLPRTKARLGRLITDGNASLATITDAMAHDPLLTAVLLGQANLAAPAPVTRPTQALISLGFTSIETVLGDAREVSARQRQPLAACFALGNATAVLMRIIADYRSTRLPHRPDDETLHICGLLHDLGTVIAILHFTDKYVAACRRLAAGEGPLSKLLEEILGLDACALGGHLAACWNLPPPYATVIAWHAKPLAAPSEWIDLVALVHLSRTLARALGFHAPGDLWLDPVEEKAAEMLGLGRTDLERVLNRALDDLEEMQLFESLLLNDG